MPSLGPESATAVGEVIVQMVHLSLLEMAGRASDAASACSLRDRIKALVARRLGDPTLRVAAIAQALACSRRALYNAFAEEPDGVAGYVLRQRLLACQRDLADPREAHRTIAQISQARGFASTAHFSRCFRRLAGLSPGEYRRRAAGGG